MMGLASAATLPVPSQYPTIQAGINAAQDGDTVLVADGIYTGGGNKEIDFLGKAIVVLSESGADSCIIDCQNEDRGYYFHSGEDSTSVLAGFKIINGYPLNSNYQGGGIYLQESSPRIENCIIAFNSAPMGGGGIYCSGANPCIKNCAIGVNSAYWGGGIFCQDSSQIKIQDCIIGGNTASFLGGGINLEEYSNSTIQNCDIVQNYSGYHAGGIHCVNTEPSIYNCTISGNTAEWNGGGIYCEYSDALIQGCLIIDNLGEYCGGGFYLNNSSPIINNCTISRNEVWGGGGSGICGYLSSPMIENTIFEGNLGDYCISCTIIGISVIFCDFYNNINGNFANPPPGWGEIDTINFNGDSCDIFLNIFQNPLFADPLNGNFQITWSNFPIPDSTKSPCIDAGDPASPLDPDSTIADIGAFYFDQSGVPVDNLIITISNNDIILLWGTVPLANS
jgi:parallel beta-helix repeat protein